MLSTLLRFTGGALLGAAAGYAAGTLLAPKSGDELQSDLRNYWSDVLEAGREAEAERRAQLQSQFSEAKRFQEQTSP